MKLLRTPPFLPARRKAACAKAALTACFLTAFFMAFPAQAGSISITYSFSGMGTITGMSGNFLDLTGAATGSVDQSNAAVNAIWNPVTDDDSGQLNLLTGLENGIFSMTFADGDTLSGTVSENQSMVNPATMTSPFTQTLIFTAGTGEFAGVSGTASGAGSVTPTGYTESGSGTLNTSNAPEPASFTLIFGSLLVLFAARKTVRQP